MTAYRDRLVTVSIYRSTHRHEVALAKICQSRLGRSGRSSQSWARRGSFGTVGRFKPAIYCKIFVVLESHHNWKSRGLPLILKYIS